MSLLHSFFPSTLEATVLPDNCSLVLTVGDVIFRGRGHLPNITPPGAGGADSLTYEQESATACHEVLKQIVGTPQFLS